jgi:signal peptidase I
LEAESHRSTFERVGCELVAGTLRAGNEVRVRVAGSSMVPTLWPGDELTVRAMALAEPSRGDLLLFVRDGRLCTHRLIDRLDRAGATQLITRGDAASEYDPPIAASEVLGTVASIERGGQKIPISSSPARRLLSLAIRHSDLMRRAALKIHFIRSRSWTVQ